MYPVSVGVCVHNRALVCWRWVTLDASLALGGHRIRQSATADEEHIYHGVMDIVPVVLSVQSLMGSDSVMTVGARMP